MASILVYGEVLFDQIPESGKSPETGELHLGGAPANCAVGISSLSRSRVLFVGGVGTDELGKQAYRSLNERGVIMEYVTRTDAPTRIVKVRKDRLTGKRSFDGFQNGVDATYADQDIEAMMVHHACFEKEIVLAYTGSLAMAGEHSRDALREMLALATEKNIPVFFDVNLRPAFFVNQQRMFEAVKEVLGNTAIVKISEDEIPLVTESVLGERLECSLEDDAKLKECCRRLHERYNGLKMIFLTFGESGSYLWQVNGPSHVYFLDIAETIDETGAGDAYCAGAITEIIKQWERDKILGEMDSRAIVEQASKMGERATQSRGAWSYLDNEKQV